MKILVTGGAGYIGSHTIIELLKNPEYEVISIDNFSNSTAEAYDKIEKISRRKITTHEVDLTDLIACQNIFKQNKIDGIIHFAALKSAPESVEKPLLYFQNNINSLLNILKCSSQHNVNHLIYSSSCSVYGNATQQPVDENTPLKKAQSPYAATKKIGEEMIEYMVKSDSTKRASILRYFNPVGAHSSGLIGEFSKAPANNLFPVLTENAIGLKEQFKIYGSDYNTPDGTCIRDFVHVSDIARAHILALSYLMKDKSKAGVEVFNLGSGKGNSVYEVVKAFESETQLKLNYKFAERRKGDVVEIYADNKKAREQLGWEPEMNLREMINSAWRWQMNQGKHS